MSEAASQCPAARVCCASEIGAPDTVVVQWRRRTARLLFGPVGWMFDQWRRRQVIIELNRLNDHFLHDIGIARGEIDDVADDMVRRRRANRR